MCKSFDMRNFDTFKNTINYINVLKRLTIHCD